MGNVQNVQYVCPKCGNRTYETDQFQATGGNFAKLFDVQNKRFVTVSCTRCGYTVVPKALNGHAADGSLHTFNSLWNRRHTTKFNGTAYIVQRGAEAIFSEEGQKQVKALVAYYMENARIIREGLQSVGLQVFGGVNAPYIWLKTPNAMPSWDFFDKLLQEVNIVGTPGAGFGPCGEGYFRLTAFGDRENTLRAVERIKTGFKF